MWEMDKALEGLMKARSCSLYFGLVSQYMAKMDDRVYMLCRREVCSLSLL